MDGTTVGIIVGISIGAIVLAVLFVFLYIYVFSRISIRKQVKELERKYSYLDALLIGQDSQYIRRLEIISHTNLLYVDKHAAFSARFKEIYEGDNRFADQLLKELSALIANNQYKSVKGKLVEAKKAVLTFEESVNGLDADLYAIIKLEEEARQKILKLKEKYRVTKQKYYSNASDLELVSASINKVLEKLDSEFTEYEEHVESAEYDEADVLTPHINNVIDALDHALDSLGSLCSLINHVIPEKISDIDGFYHQVLVNDIPLYHLDVDQKINVWFDKLKEIKNKVIALTLSGVLEECNALLEEINQLNSELEQEVSDKAIFEQDSGKLYSDVKTLDNHFLKVCSALPGVYQVFVIEDEQKMKVDSLKADINKLWNTKRALDGFIHSETKQPFSVLRNKLDDLKKDYETANTSLLDFKAYLDSLVVSSKEARNLVALYFYRNKQIEALIKQINLPDYTMNYSQTVESIYRSLNEIDSILNTRPIDVRLINEKVEALKLLANDFFEAVEEDSRNCLFAESAVVYANRDRYHQSDVNQQLSLLEQNFNRGEFEKVYKEATSIYQRSHVEEVENA